jgi:hypothetical protein
MVVEKIVDLVVASDLPEDTQPRISRKVLGWLIAALGLILLNISAALLSASKSPIAGWALLVAGLLLLSLAFFCLRRPAN